MKQLFDYIAEAAGSNYDEFMDRIKKAKTNSNGQGIIIQFINNQKSVDFDTEIGYFSSLIIPYNVRNTYSLMKFKGASSRTPVDNFIKKLKGKQVGECEFESSGFPHRGPAMYNVSHTYTVKVYLFDVEEASKLTRKQLSFIEKPSMYFGAHSSGFFGIVSIDRPYIWDVIDEYL